MKKGEKFYTVDKHFDGSSPSNNTGGEGDSNQTAVEKAKANAKARVVSAKPEENNDTSNIQQAQQRPPSQGFKWNPNSKWAGPGRFIQHIPILKRTAEKFVAAGNGYSDETTIEDKYTDAFASFYLDNFDTYADDVESAYLDYSNDDTYGLLSSIGSKVAGSASNLASKASSVGSKMMSSASKAASFAKSKMSSVTSSFKPKVTSAPVASIAPKAVPKALPTGIVAPKPTQARPWLKQGPSTKPAVTAPGVKTQGGISASTTQKNGVVSSGSTSGRTGMTETSVSKNGKVISSTGEAHKPINKSNPTSGNNSKGNTPRNRGKDRVKGSSNGNNNKPKTVTQTGNAPKVETPKANTPQIGTPTSGNTPTVNTPQTGVTPKVETPKTDTPQTGDTPDKGNTPTTQAQRTQNKSDNLRKDMEISKGNKSRTPGQAIRGVIGSKVKSTLVGAGIGAGVAAANGKSPVAGAAGGAAVGFGVNRIAKQFSALDSFPLIRKTGNAVNDLLRDQLLIDGYGKELNIIDLVEAGEKPKSKEYYQAKKLVDTHIKNKQRDGGHHLKGSREFLLKKLANPKDERMYSSLNLLYIYCD